MNAKHTPSASELGAERLGFGGESLEDAARQSRVVDRFLDELEAQTLAGSGSPVKEK